MHPDARAAVGTTFMRLILRDFIGVVDFAMVDAAGVDVKWQAEQRL